MFCGFYFFVLKLFSSFGSFFQKCSIYVTNLIYLSKNCI